MRWLARARAYDGLVLDAYAARRSASVSQRRANRLAKRIVVLDAALAKRKEQARHDQRYIDLLEEFVSHRDLANIRAQLQDESRS